MAKKQNKVTKNLVIKGELIFYGKLNEETTTKYDKNYKIRMAIKNPQFKDESDQNEYFSMYDECNEMFKPNFIKKGILPEYINFKSNFPITIKDVAGNELASDDINSHAIGYLEVKLTSEDDTTNVYPVAFKMIKNGEPYHSDVDNANW